LVEVITLLLYNAPKFRRLEMYLAKTFFALITTICISAMLTFPAFAAEIARPQSKSDSPGGLSVSPTIGGYFFAGSEQRSVAPLYGIKIGYEKIEKSGADSLGVEGTLNYFSSAVKGGAGTDKGCLYRLDATYPFSAGKKWLPFLAVGVGGIVTDTPAQTNSNFLFNYGAGVKYFIENYLAVRLDARQLVVYEGSEFRNNYEIGFGLSYYFGKERVQKRTPLPVPEKKKIVVLEDVPVKPEEAVKSAVNDGADKTEAAASQAAAPSVEMPVTPVVKSDVITKLSIEFDKSSSSVKPEYFKQLEEVKALLKGSGELVAYIDGHSDAGGKLAANVTLSEQRAQNVRSLLIKAGASPKQLTATAHGPAMPIADNATLDGRQKNRRVTIRVEKRDPALKIAAAQALQDEADRIENARLAAQIFAKSRIKAAVALQETGGAVPVDSNNSLSFEMINQGMDTEEYTVTLAAPKEFDAILTRANRTDEKITTLRLAPGETFKGKVLFRIPSGMVDGQRTSVAVRAVSTKYSDVFFEKESLVICAAPLIRVVAKLSKQEVAPGETVLYQLSLHNAGSLAARNVTVKLQLPPQVDPVGTPEVPFSKEASGLLVFTLDKIESDKRAEITVAVKVREESAAGQELLWNVEVIDGTLQKRTKSTERASVVRAK